jgi:hypothetical protein
MAVVQFGLRHIDCALMVRNHHGREVGVDIARWLHCHVHHHLAHSGLVLGHEGRFRSLLMFGFGG